MKKYIILIIGAGILFCSLALADSPLTSTAFHKAYLDVAMVKQAKQKGVVDRAVADFLVDNKIALDVKAAAVNALGWSSDGKKNAEAFSRLAFDKPLKDVDINKLDAENLLCLGYMIALDDYFHADKALPYLEKAREKKPKSYTIAIVLALVKAQVAMDSDWCQVWKTAKTVFDNNKLTEDPLRKEAMKIIFDYVVLYRSDCN